LVNFDAPTVNDPVEALPRAVALQRLTGKLFAERTSSIAPYVGTATTARDMLSIMDALGQGSLVEVVDHGGYRF